MLCQCFSLEFSMPQHRQIENDHLQDGLFVSVSSGQLTLTADHFGWPIAHLTRRNGWYEATKWPIWKLLERHIGTHGPCVRANNHAFCLLLTLTDALTVRPYRPLPVPRFSISAILPCNISHFVLQYDPFNRAKVHIKSEKRKNEAIALLIKDLKGLWKAA